VTADSEARGCFIGGFHSVPKTNRFSHEAMATVFEVYIAGADAEYARQAAAAVFQEVDRLEALFSRFIENSDIARIKNLACGESIVVDIDTLQCLQVAVRIYEQTGGAFDITAPAGAAMQPDSACIVSKTPSLKLDADECSVGVSASDIQIDLGGIGKGYAVDLAGRLLRQWNINSALVSGGYSSVLALGAPAETPGWPITFSNPAQPSETLARIFLCNRAVGSSGLLKGGHIIDPHSGRPVEGKRAAWVLAPDATRADALSTAFMVLESKQIECYCRRHQEVSAMVIFDGDSEQGLEGRIRWYGNYDREMRW